ncbi:MAG TPA: DUF3570 domain-containing protein [Kofleriaceae bacterium]|nr:DUF3570 domain-containing protein [Kofleriaceae bacterium]
MGANRVALAASLAAALGVAAACGGASRQREPGQVDARAVYYTDNSGLDVVTTAASADQPIGERLTGRARILVDRVSVSREPLDPSDPGAGRDPGGHPPHEPDAVTSASALAKGGEVAQKFRIEGLAGIEARARPGSDRPWIAGASLRASHEPDYAAASAVVGGNVELYDRNLTIGGFAGYGRDQVSPVEAPPGQKDAWPAGHHRWQAGLSASQILSPRIVVSGAAALTRQSGRLAGPYRRALVRTSLFPESVPDVRLRATGYVEASFDLGAGTALHLRQGGYRDDWGVRALVPEAAFAFEIGERGVGWVRYQYYEQWAADFYEARYPDIAPLMTGDVRLGPIRAHAAAAGARVRLAGEAGQPGALVGELSYELSSTDYLLYGTEPIIAHAPAVGLTWSY